MRIGEEDEYLCQDIGRMISHIPPLVGALLFEAVSYRNGRHTLLLTLT